MKLFSFMSQTEIFGLMAIALLLVFFFFVFLLFRYAKVVQLVKSKKASGYRANRFSKNLFFYESKKIVSIKAVLACVLLMAASLFIQNATIQPENGDLERIYRYYIDQMSGLTYEDQVAYSIQSKTNLSHIISEAETIRKQYRNGEVTREVYTESEKRAGAAELEIQVFQVIDKQLNTVGELNKLGIEAKLVYATGWKMLMQNGSNLFLMFSIMILVVPYLTLENETGFQAILSGVFIHQKRKFRRFHAMQISLAVIYALLITLMFHSGELLLIDSAYGLPNWTAYSAGAEVIFQNIHLKLVGALLLRGLFSMIGIIMIICMTKILTVYIKKPVLIILLITVAELPFYLISSFSELPVRFGITPYFGFELLYLSPMSMTVQTIAVFVMLAIVLVLQRKHARKKH